MRVYSAQALSQARDAAVAGTETQPLLLQGDTDYDTGTRQRNGKTAGACVCVCVCASAPAGVHVCQCLSESCVFECVCVCVFAPSSARGPAPALGMRLQLNSEEREPGNIRRQNIPGRGHSTCKDPEVGAGSLCARLARRPG